MLFEKQDFGDMGAFSLAWRWTDARYWLASESEIMKIRPLVPAAARRAWNVLYQETFGAMLDVREFFAVGALETRTDVDSAQVFRWLAPLLAGQSDQVVIFWEPEEAVVAEKELFVQRWDDFCYPSSDDVLVWPINGSWVLCYDHEEVFRFKQR